MFSTVKSICPEYFQRNRPSLLKIVFRIGKANQTVRKPERQKLFKVSERTYFNFSNTETIAPMYSSKKAVWKVLCKNRLERLKVLL